MVRKIIAIENTLLIVILAIIFLFSYSWAECKIKFPVVKEDYDKLPVLKTYIKSRNSGWQRFKNMMKRRIVDPICTSTDEVMDDVCECIIKKKPSRKSINSKKNENKESKQSCTWTLLSKPDGTSTFKYANLYPCDDVYLTQGYEAHDRNVYDVFVVKEIKNGDDPPLFILKEVARTMDFDAFMDNNQSYWNQVYLQWLSAYLNWDKHYF